jgi:uracil-DNA glycosylase
VTIDPGRVAPLLGTWDELTQVVTQCVACADLAAARTRVVPGVAPRGARVVLIGEAPGAQEDAAGLPFVGRSGALLDRLLAEVGLPRSTVAVANVLKCRPPRNRTPRRAEVERCRPWLVRQLQLIDPAVVVTLGSTALAWARGPAARIGALRGRPHPWEGRQLVATYHPSAAIRFGPYGAPMTALRDDLKMVAGLLAESEQ